MCGALAIACVSWSVPRDVKTGLLQKPREWALDCESRCTAKEALVIGFGERRGTLEKWAGGLERDAERA